MIVSWIMARRRIARDDTPSVIGALWPLVVDLAAIAGFAYLMIGIVVWSAYADPPPTVDFGVFALLGGIVVVAVTLALALVTTWRALVSR